LLQNETVSEHEALGVLNILNYWNMIARIIDDLNNNTFVDLDNCKHFYNIPDNDTNPCLTYLIAVYNNLDNYTLNYRDANNLIKPWGEVHYNHYPHSPFDKNSILKQIFSKKMKTGGTKNSIKVSKSRYNDLVNGPFVSTHSANLKFVCDLSDITRPYIISDTGNSGNVLSKYYDNLIEKSENNELIKIKDHKFNDDVDLLISFPEPNTLIIRNK
jgi:acyl-homoserine lactone acylase PvdQ